MPDDVICVQVSTYTCVLARKEYGDGEFFKVITTPFKLRAGAQALAYCASLSVADFDYWLESVGGKSLDFCGW